MLPVNDVAVGAVRQGRAAARCACRSSWPRRPARRRPARATRSRRPTTVIDARSVQRAREREDVAGARALRRRAAGSRRGRRARAVAPAVLQARLDHQQLDPAVAGLRKQARDADRGSAASPRPASSASSARRTREVDRTAVVGIDQRQIPQLGPLVDVRDAGRGDLEDDLRQRVADPGDQRSRPRSAAARRGTASPLDGCSSRSMNCATPRS